MHYAIDPLSQFGLGGGHCTGTAKVHRLRPLRRTAPIKIAEEYEQILQRQVSMAVTEWRQLLQRREDIGEHRSGFVSTQQCVRLLLIDLVSLL
jgi:hypothetical protein